MVLTRGYDKWLNYLKTFIEVKFRAVVTKAPHSVQFVFKGIDVDLLVSPYWRDQHELYRFLNGIRDEKTQSK